MYMRSLWVSPKSQIDPTLDTIDTNKIQMNLSQPSLILQNKATGAIIPISVTFSIGSRAP